MAVFSMRDLSRRLDLGSGEATELIAVWPRWKCKHRVRDEVESLSIQPVWQLLRFIFFVIYFEYLFGWTSVYVSVLVCVFTTGHKGKAAGGLLLCVYWAIGMRPPLRSWMFFALSSLDTVGRQQQSKSDKRPASSPETPAFRPQYSQTPSGCLHLVLPWFLPLRRRSSNSLTSEAQRCQLLLNHQRLPPPVRFLVIQRGSTMATSQQVVIHSCYDIFFFFYLEIKSKT